MFNLYKCAISNSLCGEWKLKRALQDMCHESDLCDSLRGPPEGTLTGVLTPSRTSFPITPLLLITCPGVAHHLAYLTSIFSHNHCEVLFLPRLTFLSVYQSLWLLLLCLTPDCLTLELWTCACDLDPCLVLFTSLLCLWYSCYCPLTIACLILPLSNKYYCKWIHSPLTIRYNMEAPAWSLGFFSYSKNNLKYAFFFFFSIKVRVIYHLEL